MGTTNLKLSRMAPRPGARQEKVRLGRGEGSGVGKTSGRGGKGQKGRAGATIRRGFEGGQMPLYRRLPKLGFTSRKRQLGVNVFRTVSVSALERFDAGSVIDPKVLAERGLISSKDRVKIFGAGNLTKKLTKKLTVKVHAITAGARKSIEAVGGAVELIGVAT